MNISILCTKIIWFPKLRFVLLTLRKVLNTAEARNDRPCTCNVTWRRAGKTVVAVEKK